MNTISHGTGNNNVDDGLDFEHEQRTARNDEVKPRLHRKPIRLWVVVGVAALIVVILVAILIPAMFLDYDSAKAEVEQETNVKLVCVLY
jgi:ABC-type Fe3+ transport system permease subunit